MSVSDCMKIPLNRKSAAIQDHLHAWRDGQMRYKRLRCEHKQEPSSPATDKYDNDRHWLQRKPETSMSFTVLLIAEIS